MPTDIYEMRSALAKALAHPLRLRILDILLSEGEKCVCQLVSDLDTGQSTVSKHLGVLRDAGVVDSRKEGLTVFYWVRTPCIQEFFNCADRVLRADLKARQGQIEGAVLSE